MRESDTALKLSPCAPTFLHRSEANAAPRGFWPGKVTAALSRLSEGLLSVRAGEDWSAVFGRPAFDGLAAHVTVHDPRFWRRVALGGSLGAAEAYADGDWDADDLTAAVRLLVRNRGALSAMEGPLTRASQTIEAVRHLLRRNTRQGARRNIADHYDLGNDFFARVLDPTMTYSCGLFERPDSTLEEASVAKIDVLCRRLRLGPRDHLLEIGTGWGALAIHAARRYGCRVTTTTISGNQHALATERVRAAGLEGTVEVLLRDYRDLEGTYDKLVSVEMIEAVGAEYYPAFFAKCAALLREDGLMAMQAITVDDREFERARREVDFIKRWIFPGGCLPSTSALLAAAKAASDLRLRHLDDIGPHYATTLAAWRDRSEAAAAEGVRPLAEPHFRRLWRYYLSYCEAGFRERYLGDVQLLFARPRAR
jgi:cyclopropane-fatty-acyl-phospholipid synthase